MSRLLNAPSPAYSHVTVRRAFIVYLHCGQTNKFRQVCNYFHFLESLEDTLSIDDKAVSRRHELDLFSNRPPTSFYLTMNHPMLYTHRLKNYNHRYDLEAVRNEKCVFKLEGFDDILSNSGATKQERDETSLMIRKYCYSHSITLKKFLTEFKEYAAKCELNISVQNIANYIKSQMIKEEMTMIANCPRTFSFLEEDCEPVNEESNNFLINQMRLLDTVRLSPTVTRDGGNPWNNEHLNSKILSTKHVFATNSSQRQIPPRPEQLALNIGRLNVLRQMSNAQLGV